MRFILFQFFVVSSLLTSQYSLAIEDLNSDLADQDHVFLAQKAKQKSTRSKSTVGPTTSASSSSFAWHLFPLGIGHFVDKRFFSGVFYGALQITGVSLFAVKNASYDKKVNDLNSWVDEQDATGNAVAAEGDQDALNTFTAERDAEYIKRSAAADDEKNMAYIGLGLFAGGYVISILHRVIAGPPVATTPEKPKAPLKKSKVKKTAELDLSLLEDSSQSQYPAFSWVVQPVVQSADNGRTTRLDVSLSWHF